MAKGNVYYKTRLAGILEKSGGEYIFTYDSAYLQDAGTDPISFSFPKQEAPFRSKVLFPFFFGLLSEGAVKKIQCAKLRIDENDHFTRLLKTAGYDTIGAVIIEEVPE